jgi:hypothetical protein
MQVIWRDGFGKPEEAGQTGESPRTTLGLTDRARRLYSAGSRQRRYPMSRCPCGGIGRRARLKIEFRKECWFDSGQGHQIKNINYNNNLQY